MIQKAGKIYYDSDESKRILSRWIYKDATERVRYIEDIILAERR